jgi:hypothetical protein
MTCPRKLIQLELGISCRGDSDEGGYDYVVLPEENA